ncbi:hypothetical protein CLV24_105164 [Pontibacter ummariensis]|uniref:DUF2231 domain-containing protein n=1 Tax=Pontibacter ummariensis TaxID=1610492 RepID=A0A239DQZ5_9BACT|nr:DUF2231 domain-containing protein [Pontibacter ummariensis]PRY13794.1 hypothetical protein CLV24_105164 [Pontibacter ummariensis]SNS34930.1 hypothetical protein SAMN06296052_10588 [Pontibacter ummariensis]
MMKNTLLTVLLMLLMCLFHTKPLQAHGGAKHGKAAQTEDKAQKPDTSAVERVAPDEHAAHVEEPATAHARPEDFPNKHPLVVHFPIVLLLIAAAVQLCNVLFLRRELDWMTTVATLIGFSTAYYVTNIDHPHAVGLTAHARLVLDQHDRFAVWTVYLSGVGLGAQLLNQFLFKGRRWSVAVVALVLAGAAYSVAMAGHYGAQLVHIEGVGPQGKYLETDHH